MSDYGRCRIESDEYCVKHGNPRSLGIRVTWYGRKQKDDAVIQIIQFNVLHKPNILPYMGRPCLITAYTYKSKSMHVDV